MKKRTPRVVRFPQTPQQLAVLKKLAVAPSWDPWLIFDRHEGKAAGTMTRQGVGAKPCVERDLLPRQKRFRYRITEEGRLALARAESEEAERLRRYDPFGPQAAVRR